MKVVEETGLWQRSLGASVDSENGERFRTRLVVALTACATVPPARWRDRQRPSDFPVHDVSFDALWGLADRIAGRRRRSPDRGFVFGAAVLVHDLGMASAAYVDGADSIQQDPRWRTGSPGTAQCQRPFAVGGRGGGPAEVASRPRLPLARAARGEGRAADLRQLVRLEGKDVPTARGRASARGLWPTIGLIATATGGPSQPWASALRASSASRRLSRRVDHQPLPLACLLRLADASHLSGSRAPASARLRNPVASRRSTGSSRRTSRSLRREGPVRLYRHAFRRRRTRGMVEVRGYLRAVDDEFRAVDSCSPTVTKCGSRSAGGGHGKSNGWRARAHGRLVSR